MSAVPNIIGHAVRRHADASWVLYPDHDAAEWHAKAIGGAVEPLVSLSDYAVLQLANKALEAALWAVSR